MFDSLCFCLGFMHLSPVFFFVMVEVIHPGWGKAHTEEREPELDLILEALAQGVVGVLDADGTQGFWMWDYWDVRYIRYKIYTI